MPMAAGCSIVPFWSPAALKLELEHPIYTINLLYLPHKLLKI